LTTCAECSLQVHQWPFGPQWKSYGTGCGAGATTACAIPSSEPVVATGTRGGATAGIGDTLLGGQGVGRAAASITAGCARTIGGTSRGADATALVAGGGRGRSTGAGGVAASAGFGGGTKAAAEGGGIGGGEADATGTSGAAAAGAGSGCGGGTGGSRLSNAAIEVNWLGLVVFRLRN